jgi:geranylgeranyl diphosphate synthase, type II
MDISVRIERALEAAIAETEAPGGPPLLAAAVRHAVFPGGARIRPRLCLGVAQACGDKNPVMADTAAAAIELLHCASLVHDDLPCFDNSELRRGKPSVHMAYGEPLAVLAGDALITLAFDTLARNAGETPKQLSELVLTLSRALGAPSGIIAGQAWECEPHVTLTEYHRAKTAALFVASSAAGAISCGHDPKPWRIFGERIGEAFQVADDIRDIAGSEEEGGKPSGRDRDLGRPSAAKEFGLQGAVQRMKQLLADMVASVPSCPGQHAFRELMLQEASKFLPKSLAKQAA